MPFDQTPEQETKLPSLKDLLEDPTLFKLHLMGRHPHGKAGECENPQKCAIARYILAHRPDIERKFVDGELFYGIEVGGGYVVIGSAKEMMLAGTIKSTETEKFNSPRWVKNFIKAFDYETTGGDICIYHKTRTNAAALKELEKIMENERKYGV